jgi:hypothetical protein
MERRGREGKGKERRGRRGMEGTGVERKGEAGADRSGEDWMGADGRGRERQERSGMERMGWDGTGREWNGKDGGASAGWRSCSGRWRWQLICLPFARNTSTLWRAVGLGGGRRRKGQLIYEALPPCQGHRLRDTALHVSPATESLAASTHYAARAVSTRRAA